MSSKKISPRIAAMIAARKKKKLQKKTVQEEPEQETQTASIESFSAEVDNSFFYTSDKKINQMNDDEILNAISLKYEDFCIDNKDSILKKTLLQILEDKKFVNSILDYFQIDIQEFIKVIYRGYSFLFNALFIKKVRDKLAEYDY